VAAPSSRQAHSDLDARIDALYQRPLPEFTAARNALAKTLPRDEAAQVKRLAKPTVVPWAVNQVYWHARSIYDRLLEAGAAVRRAEIAAIEKPGATDARLRQARDNVREAAEAHRRAVADAVHQANRLAAQSGVQPPADLLTRMLEAVSLTSSPSGRHGRLTEIVQPAGFEALFGVAPAPRSEPAGRDERRAERPTPVAADTAPSPASTKRAAVEAQRARQAALDERMRTARADLTAARDAERDLKRQADVAGRELREAERSLALLRAAYEKAAAAAQRAASDRETAERALEKISRES
jgi:hypothetical protein